MSKQPFYIGQQVLTTKFYGGGAGLLAIVEALNNPIFCPVCQKNTWDVKINIHDGFICEMCIAPIERTRINYVVKEVYVDAEISEKAKKQYWKIV